MRRQLCRVRRDFAGDFLNPFPQLRHIVLAGVGECDRAHHLAALGQDDRECGTAVERVVARPLEAVKAQDDGVRAGDCLS